MTSLAFRSANFSHDYQRREGHDDASVEGQADPSSNPVAYALHPLFEQREAVTAVDGLTKKMQTVAVDSGCV